MNSTLTTTEAQDPQNYTFIPSCSTDDYYLFACLNESRFLGCCTDPNACANGCNAPTALGNMLMQWNSSGNVSSFAENLIPNQTCLENGQSSDGVWSNCPEKAFDLNFVGCCSSDPCYDGCPEGDLVPTFLPQTGLDSAPFFWSMNSTLGQRPIPQNWIRYIVSFDLDSGSYKRLPGNSSNASSSSATGLTSSTTSTATAFVAGSTGDFSTTSQRSMSSSIIAGSVVGSVACLILLAALLAFLLRRKSAHPRNDVDAAQTPETSGKVETIDPGSSSTKIDHEPIEGSTGTTVAIAEAPAQSSLSQVKINGARPFSELGAAPAGSHQSYELSPFAKAGTDAGPKVEEQSSHRVGKYSEAL